MLSHLSTVWAYRYFWMSLVKMDILTRYRRSVLGIGWSMLHPLAMTAVFCVVFSTLMNAPNWVEYAQQTLAGMAVWAFLRDTTLQGCQALIRHEGYIRQTQLPYSIYSLRVMLSNLVHFSIALTVVVLLVAATGATWTPFVNLWAVLPAVVLAAVFVWATATIAAFATVYFHDVSHMMELGAQVLFFLTPIIFSMESMQKSPVAWIVEVNPVVPFIEMIRLPIVKGEFPPWERYAYGFGLTVSFGGLAVGTVAWLQKKVIFHL